VVLHHLLGCVLLRLEESRVELRKDKTGELDDGGEGEGVGKDYSSDLLFCACEVKWDQGKPVDRVDAVGEEDEPSLIEAIWALAGLEGVEGGEHDQQEGEEEAGHEPALFNSRADQDPLVEEVDVQRLGWRDDQPDHVYANLDHGEGEADEEGGRW